MAHVNLDAEFLMYVLGKVLRAVDGAVLASCAPEAEHQVGEATLDVAASVSYTLLTLPTSRAAQS